MVGSDNDIPVADAQAVTTDEDTAATVTLTGSDADGDTLSFTVVADPAHGSLSGTVPDLTYTPDADYNGADSFTFKVNDGTIDSNSATVSITVDPVNDVPVAGAQTVSTNENTAALITLTGSDIDGDTLTYTIVANPTHGTLSGTVPNLTYTPVNYNGVDSFTFKVNDGTIDSNPATVSITINPISDAPLANAQTIATDEDTTLAIILTGFDADGDALTYTTVSSPTDGILNGTAPNLSYIPNLNYNGSDSFTFKVNDGATDSPAATVSITVNTVNDAPSADAQSLSTDEGQPLSIYLTGSDVENDALTYSIATLPAHGTLDGLPPNLVYTPELNFFGADSFAFIAGDSVTNSAPATVDITVNYINDLPSVVVTTPTGTTNGFAQIFYNLIDLDPVEELCDILVEYRVSVDSTWIQASTAGVEINLTPADGLFVYWHAAADQPHTTGDNYQVRITPSDDLGTGPAGASGLFSIDTVNIFRFPDTGQTTSYTDTFGEDSDYTQNPHSYTDNDDGTVTDNVTGLVWQQEDDNTTRTWQQALDYAAALNTIGYAGYDDWRVPTKKELLRMIDSGQANPAIDTAYFPNTNSAAYWSSTTYANYTGYAWSVYFDFGYVYSYNDKTGNYYVRCVRGGQ